MRLALVTPVFPSDLDQPSRGAGIGAVTLLQSILAQEPSTEAHVVHYRAPLTQPARQIGDSGITVHALRGSLLARASLPVAPMQGEVARVLGRIRPDIVHVRGTASFVDGARWPSVLSIHGITEEEVRRSGARQARLRSLFHRLREPAARRRYAHVIAIAGYVARALEHQLSGRIHFVPNPISESFFEAAGDRRDTGPVIVQAADICPIKNTAASVEAAGILARRGVDFRLRLLGECTYPDYGRALEQRIAALGIGDRVEIAGRVGREQMPATLAEARVLLSPSFVEVAPLSIAEASAVGLPVVASPAGGSAEMVVDGYTGRLVNPRCPESIADALTPFLQDAALASLMGQRARPVAERHRPASVGRATLGVYDQVRSEH